MNKFNTSVSPVESITCRATIYSYSTNLMYIAFFQKQTQFWSEVFQKNGKYKVTITKGLIQNKHLISARALACLQLAAICSDLTNPLSSTEVLNCLATTNTPICSISHVMLAAWTYQGWGSRGSRGAGGA